MRKIFLALCISAVAFTACKKDDAVAKTPQELAVAKWAVDKQIDNDYYSSTNHPDTTYGTTADYADFRNDGKVYLYIYGQRDTSTYSVQNATSMTIDGDPYTIVKLDNNNFQIYSKDTYGVDYYESTIYLKK